MTRPLPFKPAALIFDLDGLVLDTESGFIEAWRQAAAQLGYRPAADLWTTLGGLPGDLAMARIAGHCGANFDTVRFAQLAAERWRLVVTRDGIAVKPGLSTLLQKLAMLKLPYCLATNSPRDAALACLQMAGIAGHFPLLVCRDDVHLPKPAPDLFLQAGRLLDAAMADCLVLEDSAVGVAAAVAAGAPCVYIPSSMPADGKAAAQAWQVLDDLTQVAALI